MSRHLYLSALTGPRPKRSVLLGRIWTYIIALILGGLTVIPFGFVYALSNFQVSVGVFNELIYGYMLDANGTSRHPIGSLVYRVISGQCWYRAQSFLQDQKIGHYMHVPPRAVFFAQLFGTIIGAPINYGTIRWILDSKKDYLTGEKTDPNHQWTGQQPISYNAAAVQYGLIGPKRLFVVSAYSPLLYGFLLGALAPVLIWGLHRRFPKAKFNLWNTTIFTNQLGNFTGNLSTGPLTSFIVAFCEFETLCRPFSSEVFILTVVSFQSPCFTVIDSNTSTSRANPGP